MPQIVVVGASQGGIAALQNLVRGLPKNFSAPVLVVLHTGAAPSVLPTILAGAGSLGGAHAENRERLKPGHIHVAPPDHHMLLVEGFIELSRGPRENWARPAIDPLFRTAAEAYGPDVIGVVLTGRLNDGTAGLYEIKRRGGVCVVQDPDEAEAPSMPRSALENVSVDYCLPIADISDLLVRLVEERKRTPLSMISGSKNRLAAADSKLRSPTAQTCPECGGAMQQEIIGNLMRFRCHIGHVMTKEVLAAAQLALLERDISVVLRALNERAGFCHDIAEKYEANGDHTLALSWSKAAEEAHEREASLRTLTEAEWTRPETRLDDRSYS